MRTERAASQILFGMLPTQTIDLQGRVWKVAHWADPVELVLDQASVRRAIIDAVAPWTATGQDDDLAQDLFAQAKVDIVGVNPDRGVIVEPFPKQWRCRNCGRISVELSAKCRCGADSRAQMQFVAYHECGALREPRLPSCSVHHAVAVRLPGTAAARELYFFCPECKTKLSKGFPYIPCSCGNGGMNINVHRAGVVFSPQYADMVNPTDPALAAKIRASGGGARALEWILSNMEEPEPQQGAQTVEGLVEMLLQQNISPDLARSLAEQAAQKGEVRRGSPRGEVQLPDRVRERAQEEALSISSAIDGGHVRVRDMIAGTTPPLQLLYSTGYKAAIERARLISIELLTNFPIAKLAYGYTRGDAQPGRSRLVAFRDRGGIRAYGNLNHTEALLFQLDPVLVHRWLVGRGFALDSASTAREARLAILHSVEIPRASDTSRQPLGEALLTMLHSYAHRMIRSLASSAGVERDGLSEYLLPHHLSIIVYAASHSEFVLGGLQAVFETALDRVLERFVTGEVRCPMDPGCRSGGGACMACLHLGEPSCRWFNQFLDRAALFSERGYMRMDISD